MMRESIDCLLTVLQRKTGCTLQQIAKRTGISVTLLRKWRDDGNPNPGLQEMRIWKHLLRIPLDAIDALIRGGAAAADDDEVLGDLKSFPAERAIAMAAYKRGDGARLVVAARRAF